MRYVILRDDDTNAFTPIDCLERLYRPFLDRKLPVNLATIPRVRTDTLRMDGKREEFIFGASVESHRSVPLTQNGRLIHYLHENSGYHVVQHGYHHTMNEFASGKPEEIRHRIERGRDVLDGVGFAEAKTFVAPYDQYSPLSVQEIAQNFRVFSTGWFELRKLPMNWWPLYALKKMLRRPHWRIGRTLLLSHPGCLLSRHRPCANMLNSIRQTVARQQITVLVTHWWEYFSDGEENVPFIRVLHDTAAWLADQADVKVIAFDDLESKALVA